MTSKYVRHHSRIRVGGKCPHWIIVFIYVHFPRKSKLCVDAFAVQSSSAMETPVVVISDSDAVQNSSAMETPVVVISDSEDLPPSDAVHKKRTCIDLLNSISPASWLFMGNPAKRSRHSDASILRILGPERVTGEDWLQAPLLLILNTCHL